MIIMQVLGGFKKIMKGRKTYLISLAIIAQAAVKVYYGDMDIYSFITSPELVQVLEGTGLASLRAGVQSLMEKSQA